MNKNIRVSISEILIKLEIDDKDNRFLNIMKSPSFEVAQRRLEDFKVEVLKKRRLLAKKYHPDISPENIEKMKEINALVDFVRSIRIERQRPVPMNIFVHVDLRGTGNYDYANITRTDYSSTYTSTNSF